jgi:hypothetical protein
VALESYFDGSNTGGWEHGSVVTLAGFAADDTIWTEFDEGWKAILGDSSRRPSVDHLHMRRAAHLLFPFDYKHGWNMQRVGFLIADLLMYLQTIDKKRFRQFACTVDLEAYRRVAAEGLVQDSPITVCLNNCPYGVLSWYVVDYPGLIHSAHFFFDENEPFMQPFEDKWTLEKNRLVAPGGSDMFWSLIKTVTTATMKDKPALQAADLLAWASNRAYTANADRAEVPFRYLEHIMKEVIPSMWCVWNEDRFREYYRNGKTKAKH